MIHERVDDIPLLLAEMQRLGLGELLDEHFPTHGNWDGLSLGQVTLLWLTHVLSQADHCLNHVQPWAQSLWRTLAAGLGTTFRLEDLDDERLATVLRYLAGPAWSSFQAALNARTLRVYDLPAQRVRLDSTTVSSYQQVDADGLFQFGHSKDARQRLPVLKLMAATLDPLGLPLVTTTLSGEHAEDPLYVPAMEAVYRSLQQRGLLYIGDSKMGALATRAWVQQQGDYYLCPLGEKQCPAATLDAYLLPVWSDTQVLEELTWTNQEGKTRVIAAAFSLTVELTADSPTAAPAPVSWQERRLVVRSCAWAEQARTQLHERLAAALTQVQALGVRKRGKRRFHDQETLHTVVEQILQRHRVAGLVRLEYTSTPPAPRATPPAPQAAKIPKTPKTAKPAKPAKPAKAPPLPDVTVTATIDPIALAAAERRLGWRVYATNAPEESLSLAAAVGAYREQYHIEHAFGRLKGQPLSLQPMYLSRDDHATGLVRLLSLALRVLTLVEYQVRQRLSDRGTPLAGIYPGQPRRSTYRPSTELLLRAWRGVTLTIWEQQGETRRYLTPLTPLQQELLRLLDLPATIYTHLLERREEPG